MHPEPIGIAQNTIAETYLSYLNSQQAKSPLSSPTLDLPGTPFLQYNQYDSLHWGLHAKRGNLSHCAKILVLEFFGDYINHRFTKIRLKAQALYTYDDHFDNFSVFSRIHRPSTFGIDEISTNLVGRTL